MRSRSSATTSATSTRSSAAKPGTRNRHEGQGAALVILENIPFAEPPPEPGRIASVRFRGRHPLLGWIQYGAGGHQLRSLLHRLPRDAHECLRGAEEHDP